jgi:hypothetical protein
MLERTTAVVTGNYVLHVLDGGLVMLERTTAVVTGNYVLHVLDGGLVILERHYSRRKR